MSEPPGCAALGGSHQQPDAKESSVAKKQSSTERADQPSLFEQKEEIPVGLCQCGCGEKTPIAKKTSARNGAVKGQPMRFCQHHCSRRLPRVTMSLHDPAAHIPFGFCKCGCGNKTPIISQTDVRKGRVKGQPSLYCPGHRGVMRKGREARSRGMYLCGLCKQEKPTSEFRKSCNGLRAICRLCNAGKSAEWRRANPEKARFLARKEMLRQKGMTLEEYQAMFDAQNGVCAICHKPERRKRKGRVVSLHVDHNHSTGKIRGLLCNACNRAIGLLHEDQDALLRAVEYLRKEK